MTKSTTPDTTPHLMHVTDRGVHLHWALGCDVGEIQRAGRALRAYVGHYLVMGKTDPVPMKYPLGWFRFGVDEAGAAVVGDRVKTL
jgi:hypothetical protein